MWVDQGKRAAILAAVSRGLYRLITMLARLAVDYVDHYNTHDRIDLWISDHHSRGV